MTTKQFLGLIVTLILCAVLLAHAQSFGAIAFSPIAPAVANCPPGPPTGTAFCTVGTAPSNYQVYVSYAGAAYQPLVPPPAAAGVTSFNGRTGVVTLSNTDVLGTGLKVTTTVTSTAVSTPQ
jgi:hypothetical protein